MMSNLKIALTAATILGAASAALANESGPPNIDIQKTCRESSNSLSGLTGNGNQDFDACINDEQTARQQLTKDWAKYPAGDRAFCVSSIANFEPTYSELATCLEMKRDLRNTKPGEADTAAPPSRRMRRR